MATRCWLRFLLALFMASLSDFPSPCFSRDLKLGDKLSEHVPLLQHDNLTVLIPFDPSKVIQLSWQPRVFFYEKFLSDEDCDHLIALAQGKLERLMVDASKENSVMYSINISSGVFLPSGQDEVVSKVEERISSWTFFPKEYGEDMLIEHTPANESYEPHYDYYHDISRLAVAGHRVATVLIYLSTISQGGEIIFPQLELKHARTRTKDRRPCAATGGYTVKPVKGSAILFFNLHPDATPDATSLHSSCPVLDGEKWTATKWIHVRNFDPSSQPMVSDKECTDEDDDCPNWAAMGECKKNPVYMLGTPDYYGTCRKSCGAC